jgi:hypothetical protein
VRDAVVRGERFATFEIAEQREIDGAPAAREAARHFDAQEPWDAADLALERGSNAREVRLVGRFQAPEHDMAHHRR